MYHRINDEVFRENYEQRTSKNKDDNSDKDKNFKIWMVILAVILVLAVTGFLFWKSRTNNQQQFGFRFY